MNEVTTCTSFIPVSLQKNFCNVLQNMDFEHTFRLVQLLSLIAIPIVTTVCLTNNELTVSANGFEIRKPVQNQFHTPVQSVASVSIDNQVSDK